MQTRRSGLQRFFSMLVLQGAPVVLAPTLVYAQFLYETNDGAITITGYVGPGGDEVIPDTIEAAPVTRIGDYAFTNVDALTRITIGNQVTNVGVGAFSYCTNLAAVVVPDSVVSIGIGAFLACDALTNVALGAGLRSIEDYAFSYCPSLAGVTIPTNVTSLGWSVFANCTSLAEVTIPDGITSIGDGTFESCSSLARIILPAGVTNIGYSAFGYDTNLVRVFFRGDAPAPAGTAFFAVTGATMYYLPGRTNWGATYAGLPTALWIPEIPGDANFGARDDGFHFTLSWARGMYVVVDAAAEPKDPDWSPISTNELADDLTPYADPAWLNHTGRVYRLRWP